MHRVMAAVLAWTALALPGCSEPLKDDRANDIVASCCGTARERVTTVDDMESKRFRDYCGMCRKGNSKSECGHGARRILEAVARAYSADLMPLECNTVHTQLKELGIEFEKPN